MPYEFDFGDFGEQFQNQGNNPWLSSQFNPNYQSIFNRAAGSYNPQQHGNDFNAYMMSQGPTQMSQIMGALQHDFGQAQTAEAQRQQMWMEGGNALQTALSEFMPGVQDAMSGFQEGMQGILGDQQDALNRFLTEGQGSLDSLQGEYDKILGAGDEAAGLMREEGEYLRDQSEYLRGQGEDYYKDLTKRADQALKDYKTESKQARKDFDRWAGKTERQISKMLQKAEAGFEDFEQNAYAQLAAEKRGHDETLNTQMQALQMSDLPPEQKAALGQSMKMDAAANYQGTAAKSWNQFQGMRLAANQQLVGAYDSAAKVTTTLAGQSAGLGAALADGMNKASAISGDLAKSGAQIGAQMDIAAGQMDIAASEQFTKAALTEFEAQAQATGLQSQITSMKFDMEQSAMAMSQSIGQMGAQAEQFVAGTLANAESLQLQGAGELASYMSSFVANPVAMADVIFAGLQAQLIGEQAGWDLAGSPGLRFGAMGQGQSGQQFYGGQIPGGMNFPRVGGEIASWSEMGFHPDAMSNLSQYLMG